MRELNPSGFLAPSSILLSRLLFVLVVVTGTLSEFGFGSKLRDPGKLVCRVTPKFPSTYYDIVLALLTSLKPISFFSFTKGGSKKIK